MNDEVLETVEESQVSRRGLLVKGGLAAAGLSVLGTRAAGAFAATERAQAGIKVAVVTHGDTVVLVRLQEGRGPGGEDLRNRGVSVTQVYANNDVAKQVAGSTPRSPPAPR